MRVSVVSRSWPSNERSGVTLAASQHVQMLVDSGHKVSIVGAHSAVLAENLSVASRSYVPANGSGALYATARVDRTVLASVIERAAPDLVVVEAWQTALTDAAVDVANTLSLPVLMISHGVALHPFTSRPYDILRALGWAHYRKYLLPRRVAGLSVLTTLDETSTSRRFYDRDLAIGMGIPVLPLVNAPVNWMENSPDRAHRKPQILVVGYFSAVKNQLSALQIMAGLPLGLRFRFVGRRSGSYYERCVKRVLELGLSSRVSFLEDQECNLAEEIANSLVVLSTSITEALPISLLEAMASGTPFVATPVGAVPSLQSGVVTANMQGQRDAIIALFNDINFWNRLSIEGRYQYKARFTRECVQQNLQQAVHVAMERGAVNV